MLVLYESKLLCARFDIGKVEQGFGAEDKDAVSRFQQLQTFMELQLHSIRYRKITDQEVANPCINLLS